MAAKIRQLMKLYALYARMDFRWFTQDTFYCTLVMVSDLISYAASISGILLLAQRFGGVGGMSADEVLFMLGFFVMADGLIMMFGGFNISHISRRVGRGQLDHMLMQPLPMWMQLATGGFLPVSGSGGFISGAALTGYAAARLQVAITPAWILSLIGLLILRLAINAGFNYLVGSAAFYRPTACEEISSLVHDVLSSLGRYPLSGLPASITGVLTTILPAGLMAWMPSQLLLHKAAPAAAWGMAAVAAGACALAALTFRKGLKHYAKYGSGRYRAMGHRS